MLYVRFQKTQSALDSCRHHRCDSNDFFHHDADVSVIRKLVLSVIRNLWIGNVFSPTNITTYQLTITIKLARYFCFSLVFSYFFRFTCLSKSLIWISWTGSGIFSGLGWYFMLSTACECARRSRQTNCAVRLNGQSDIGFYSELPHWCFISNQRLCIT